jgi:hypothetical protein
MSDYVYQTTTNKKPDSKYDVLGHLMPAKAFFFVTVDEVGPEGFLVRRTYSSVDDPYMPVELSPLQKFQLVYPEREGLWATNPESLSKAAQHVLQIPITVRSDTPFVSTSSAFPDGASRFIGKNNDAKVVYVDIAKAKRAGAKIVTPEEISRDIDDYLKGKPSDIRRKGEYLKKKSLGLDNEYLVRPAPVVPADGVFSRRGLAIATGLEKWARVVQVFGIFFTGYDIAMSGEKSLQMKSIKPLEKATLRQIAGWEGSMAGNWAAAAIGARIGASTGALCGIELGPAAVITGAIGGIIGGALAYFGESYLLDKTLGP